MFSSFYPRFTLKNTCHGLLGTTASHCVQLTDFLKINSNKFYYPHISSTEDRVLSKKLNALYSSPVIIQEIKSRLRWEGHVARMGRRRGAYRGLVGEPEGRRPLGKRRRIWKDNIKMDFREVGLGA